MTWTRRAALAQSVARLSEKIMFKQRARSGMTIRSKVIPLHDPGAKAEPHDLGARRTANEGGSERTAVERT
jgi:hypothetical protein